MDGMEPFGLKGWGSDMIFWLLALFVSCGVEEEVRRAGPGQCGGNHPLFLTTPKEIAIEPGEAFVLVTEHGEGVNGRLSRVDLNSGRIQTVVSGLIEPEGLALLPGGREALVLESFTADGANLNNRLLRIDLERCGITVVASGFTHTEGIAVEAGGKSALAVTDSFSGTISRIDLTTGKTTPVITDLAYPEGIAIEADGRSIWITQGFSGEVNRISLANGATLASFGGFHDPERIAIEPGGATALVTDEHGELIRLDLITGKTEEIVGDLSKPEGLALEGNGETVLVVVEEDACGAIARVDLRSRAKTWVVQGKSCMEDPGKDGEEGNGSELFQNPPPDPFFQ